jgi:hypothetical protein
VGSSFRTGAVRCYSFKLLMPVWRAVNSPDLDELINSEAKPGRRPEVDIFHTACTSALRATDSRGFLLIALNINCNLRNERFTGEFSRTHKLFQDTSLVWVLIRVRTSEQRTCVQRASSLTTPRPIDTSYRGTRLLTHTTVGERM